MQRCALRSAKQPSLTKTNVLHFNATTSEPSFYRYHECASAIFLNCSLLFKFSYHGVQHRHGNAEDIEKKCLKCKTVICRYKVQAGFAPPRNILLLCAWHCCCGTTKETGGTCPSSGLNNQLSKSFQFEKNC